MPRVQYTEQELTKLQELKNKKEALFTQYGNVVKARTEFIEQNTKQLIEIQKKISDINNEISKIQLPKEETF
jgi:hypothetical protein